MARRMNSPSHDVSPPAVRPVLMIGGRLSSSGLNGCASQARKPQTSFTEPGPPSPTRRKNGSGPAVAASSSACVTGWARMPGALDMTCGSPLVKTMTSPSSSRTASWPSMAA